MRPAILFALLLSIFAVPAGAAPSLTDDQKIVHALNRLAFGPRPGDLAHVKKIGLSVWIDQQLHPDAIPDAAVTEKLSGLRLLAMTPVQLHFIYYSDVIGFLGRQAQKNGDKTGDGGKAFTALIMERQEGKGQKTGYQAVARQFITRYVDAIQKANIPYGTSVQTVGELATAKVTRAIESPRQLQEVLTDFWSNHFNEDVRKGPVKTYKVADEREVIRPHVLGKFRELLGATAKSPAMLAYLDNADNKKGSVNENYARELMELHTLGVDGGYTQKDVQEIARCFTGWGAKPATGEFEFHPEAHDDGAKIVLGQTLPAGGGISDGEKVLDILAAHPSTAKFLSRKLCQRFVADTPPPALVAQVVKVFADSQGDLRSIVKAIVTSDEFNAPASDRVKIKSPFEFAVSAVRALGGEATPMDDADGLDHLRLLMDGQQSARDEDGGGSTDHPGAGRVSLLTQIAQMGEPLYSYQAPTGYPENSQKWVSSGALISRLNFALALTGGMVRGVSAPVTDLLTGVSGDDPHAVLDILGTRLLGAPLSAATQTTLLKQIPEGTPADPQKLVALVLGSPEFQRR